jgi:hypothetical protein
MPNQNRLFVKLFQQSFDILLSPGFASTPDTYVGLLALREFSTKLRIPERGTLINLQYSYQQVNLDFIL